MGKNTLRTKRNHQRNIKMQKRFLKLFKKYLQKDNTVKQ